MKEETIVVALISTGGTIACLPDEAGTCRPALRATDLLRRSGLVRDAVPVSQRQG